MESKELLATLIGTWRGTCRTWFQPGELADESELEGTFAPVLDGLFLRHTYRGKIKGQDRHGEELIGFNSVQEVYEIAWVDDFHMNYAIQNSSGEATARGFSVVGNYDVASGQPPWGWRTVYELSDDDQLTITAFNISPDGVEDQALETIYRRVGEG